MHFGSDCRKLLAHFGPNGRKLMVHLGAKLHDLRLEGGDPCGHFFELFHVLFKNRDAALQIGIGH